MSLDCIFYTFLSHFVPMNHWDNYQFISNHFSLLNLQEINDDNITQDVDVFFYYQDIVMLILDKKGSNIPCISFNAIATLILTFTL